MSDNSYTSYDHLDDCDPPLIVYAEGAKRIILLSAQAFTEVGAELNISLPVFASKDILVGSAPTNLNARHLAIDPRLGEESQSPKAINQDKIVLDFIIRVGTDGTPLEQLKRCCGYITVIKRVLRKLARNGQLNELCANWPTTPNENYVPPTIIYKNLDQFPLAQNKETEFGYSAGLRLTLEATYEPYLID